MNICPEDHKHGESGSCYTRHACRCAECRTAHAEQRFYSRHMQAAGRRLATEKVDPRAVRRRLQALIARGWSLGLIGAEAGVTAGSVSLWLRSAGPVTHSTDQTVRAIYARLWSVEPPRSTTGERYAYSRARGLAEARGYVPPLGWDDIDNDPEPPTHDDDEPVIDHAAVELAVMGHKPALTRDERDEVVRRLHPRKWADPRIARYIGCSPEAVRLSRLACGLGGWTIDEWETEWEAA